VDVEKTIPWSEFYYVIKMLTQDPESWLFAAMNNWKHPISREWVVLAATYDLLAQVNSGRKKPKPFPRPWPSSEGKKKGSVRADARNILQKAKDGDLEWRNRHTRM
jgi:hypothetical protein